MLLSMCPSELQNSQAQGDQRRLDLNFLCVVLLSALVQAGLCASIWGSENRITMTALLVDTVLRMSVYKSERLS